MKAIQISEFGGPEVMEYKEMPVPSPASGQVLVKLGASGVNYIDIYHRRGLYKVDLPHILGLEGAGDVKEVGPDVETVTVGIGWRTPGCRDPTRNSYWSLPIDSFGYPMA